MHLDPHTTRIIHERMIKEELQRSSPGHHLSTVEGLSGRDLLKIARQLVASVLVTLANWIAPAPGPGPVDARTSMPTGQ